MAFELCAYPLDKQFTKFPKAKGHYVNHRLLTSFAVTTVVWEYILVPGQSSWEVIEVI